MTTNQMTNHEQEIILKNNRQNECIEDQYHSSYEANDKKYESLIKNLLMVNDSFISNYIPFKLTR